MGLFDKKPTTAQKNDINATISRCGTCCKRLESANSIDRYFTEWDKFMVDYNVLLAYEKQRIKFTVPPHKLYNQIVAEIPRIEHDIVTRGYDRMQRDAAKLSTDKSKQNKAIKYFDELEYYYPRLRPETVNYIKSLKETCSLLQNEQPVAMTASAKAGGHYFCTSCGARLEEGALFCGKCGAKK